MSILITYLFLVVILGTVSNILTKESEGFTKIILLLVSVFTIITSMYCLSQVMKVIIISYTYATFAVLCIISTVILIFIRYD